MHIELVDTLRCPQPHGDAWLVASITRMEERDILEGALGCPECGAEYPVRDGVVSFEVKGGGAIADDGDSPPEADESDVMRLAAMLDLASPGGVVLLAGDWAMHARALNDVTSVRVLLVDAPACIDAGWGVYALRAPEGVLPVGAGSMRAAALDAAHALLAPRAALALAPGGRLVAPASAPVPDGIRELVRDEEVWVGEREAAPRLVGLTRGRP
jgi:uncharacterized protein YbaR (Trm112 family)